MKRSIILGSLMAAGLAFLTPCPTSAADAAPPPEKPSSPPPPVAAQASPQELREQLRNLPPEQRQEKVRELREKWAAERTNQARLNAPPPENPERAALREQLQNMTPAERQAKLREIREKAGLPSNPEEAAKRREELQKMTPEERQARLKELRERWNVSTGGAGLGNQPADPSGARASEMRSRVEVRRAELQKKKADGTITESETKMLERLETLQGRLNRSQSPALQAPPTTAVPAPPAPAAPEKPKSN